MWVYLEILYISYIIIYSYKSHKLELGIKEVSMLEKKIGIWGSGVTGIATIKYFYEKGYKIGLMDRKNPDPEKKAFLLNHKVDFFPETEKEKFFNSYDIIVPSPGVDLTTYKKYSHKWLSEIDIFQSECKVPTIAITGTVGKTSTTHLLSQLLTKAQKNVSVGGNIGVALLDIAKEKMKDFVILELSSFQLDIAKTFAPKVAIITNLYSNHLDRHYTLEEYFGAKYNILKNQTEDQVGLINFELYEKIRAISQKPFSFFSLKRPSILNNKSITESKILSNDLGSLNTYPDSKNSSGNLNSSNPSENLMSSNTSSEFKNLGSLNTYYYFAEDNSTVLKESFEGIKAICTIKKEILNISYPINWLIIASTLDILNIKFPEISINDFSMHDHRLNLVATINNIDFYNDSKSTVPEATLAALEKLSNRPTILLVGGLSKGVNRAPFIKKLKPYVKQIICFGAEAEELHKYAIQNNISSQTFPSLDTALKNAFSKASPGDQIVFSPAGSSFDLYKNYQERGKAFKKIVQEL